MSTESRRVVRCGGSTVLNIIPEKEDRTLCDQ